MEIRKAPFSTYRRRTRKKNQFVYYIRFLDPASGEHLPGRSSHRTTKTEAIRWALEQIEKGTAFVRPKREHDTLTDYLTDFWTDDGRYAKLYAATHEQPLSSAYLLNNRSVIKNHVLPFLESRKKTKLSLYAVTPGLIEDILEAAREKGLSPRTTNIVRQAIAVPLTEAYRLGKIKTNPVSVVRKHKEKTPERQILTLGEWRALLAREWADPRYRLAVVLAGRTGMRIGEILGLQADAIEEELHSEPGPEGKMIEITSYTIHIRMNYQLGEGLKLPKTGSTRRVNISPELARALRSLAGMNPNRGGSYIFWSFDSTDHPIGKRMVEQQFNAGVRAVLGEKYLADGKTPEETERLAENERVLRGLTFHSLRHFCDRLLAEKLSPETRRKTIGHASEKMDSRYLGRTATAKERRQALEALEDALGENT